jgi:hypothetical protein
MQRYLKPNSDGVASKVVDGEAILINLSNGMYYSMDAVGGFVWALIEAGHDLDAISAAVASHYDAAAETVKQDVDALAQQLLDEGLILAAEGEAMGGPVETNNVERADAYAAPQLNKFDDMVDLFALDPPLPELSKLGGRGE